MISKNQYKVWSEIHRAYTGENHWHPALLVMKYHDRMQKWLLQQGLRVDTVEVNRKLIVNITLNDDKD